MRFVTFVGLVGIVGALDKTPLDQKTAVFLGTVMLIAAIMDIIEWAHNINKEN